MARDPRGKPGRREIVEQEQGIVGTAELSPTELAAVRELLDRCNIVDGTDLILTLTPNGPTPGNPQQYFLAYEAGTLVGALGLVGYREVEGCGMVAPEWRRRGIGRQLAIAAGDELARRGITNWLLTCDEAAPGGAAFAEAIGGVRAFAEHRMAFDPARIPPEAAPTTPLTFHQAGLPDAAALAAITSAAFGDPFDEVESWLTTDLARPDRRWFLATLAGEPIGSLRVIAEEDGVYITAFGVHPTWQGRGYGRALLSHTLALLLAEGRQPIWIEVETDNQSALGLYRACGFVEQHTYGYWRIGSGRWAVGGGQ
jgi:ribosomal protein S18 acetylase RimI-like enzyme